ncbi:23S rRNA (uracil(1939)-C(5))-methyltransferase RlmD [Fructobacillus sp. M1-13]|uniref:23S rRNA (Uracil(1939)-C(5))-methyltransferase RlmD n=1 Tax=Fructobacillus papyriferae TaxID=2713171 RepID=A0ABS5QR20_9LACO|nr:23S rRNA (uracil(1939)-C(5))-methyltransferase RlmD [Fructobacillus papyriferae]MBS9335377.1 23S rRNA (uracil(1939)-C(5))-methyltransferase RlmD [Fructobacillus papyriferae]MCD2158953.1 23S rRNA (uracil(1939)-C(5))-methyltransferase RlmD [Fructobacillus papyriferae]
MAKTTPPVKLHEIVQVEIAKIRQNGMGLAWANEQKTYPIYIANAMFHEVVQVEIIQVDKLSSYGRIVSWDKKNPARIAADRDYLLEAGTAPLVNWAYPAQKDWKRSLVKDNFEAAGLLVDVAEPVTMDEKVPSYYRNKTVVPVKWQDGQLLSGFYQRGTHELVPMTDYFVNDKRLDEVIVIVRNILEKLAISAYDPDTDEGAVRYIMVRRGYYSKQLMVVLVSNDPILPKQDEVVEAIVTALPDLTSLILNKAPKKDYVQLSADNETLYGKDQIEDSLLGKRFLIGPNSFYQVNPVMTEKLYQTAADLAQLKKSDLVVDAYAGIGTIGMSVADRVKEVIGVEVVPGAVADAQKNLALNGIENATYILKDAPEQFVEWEEEGVRPDVVFVDPPRRGLTEELIKKAALMGPDRVVYVSCNPLTAARDCALFDQVGYEIAGPVVPVDQFPQTAHIETVTVLQKKR